MSSAEFPLKGTFADVVLPALLVQAMNRRFTGMFRAERESIIKVIYFKEGDIAFASSNQPSDRLGEVLIKRGQLSREQLEMAMSKLEANVSLGRMLVELGYLSPKELLAGAKAQVEEILYSLNTWHDGNFEFVEGPLAPRIVDLKLSMRQVVLQAIMQLEDRRWVLQQIGSMETVFEPTAELSEALQAIRIEPEIQQVFNSIDGLSTVRDLCARSPLDEFTVTKAVAASYLLGLVQASAQTGSEGEYLATSHETSQGQYGHQASTVAGGGPRASETVPGFAPFAARGADADDEEEGIDIGTTTATLPVSAVGGGRDDAPSGDEELTYEEEDDDWDDEEQEAPSGARRFLVPAILAFALAGVGAAGWLFRDRLPFLGGGDGEGPVVASASPTPAAVARLTPRPATKASPAGPRGATPAGTAGPQATAGVVPSPSGTSAALAVPTPRSMPPPAMTPLALPPGTPTRLPVFGGASATPPIPPRATPGLAAPTPRAATPPPATPRAATPPPATPRTATPPPVTPRTATQPPPVTPRTATQPPPVAPRVTPPPATPRPAVPIATPAVVASAPSAAGSGITSSPAAEAARSSLNSGDYAAAAASFARMVEGTRGYSLQLEIVCQDSSVRDGWDRAGANREYILLPFRYRGRSCYRVLWGVYGSRADASRAASTVPGFFRQQLGARAVPVVPLR